MALLTDEHIKQIADTRHLALEIVDKLRGEGYSMEAVADGLMEGAISALGHDRAQFLTVLNRFRQGYNL